MHRCLRWLAPAALAIGLVGAGALPAAAAAPAHQVVNVGAVVDASGRVVSERPISTQEAASLSGQARQAAARGVVSPDIGVVDCQDGVRDDFFKFRSIYPGPNGNGELCFGGDGDFWTDIAGVYTVATGNNSGNFNATDGNYPGDGSQFCPWIQIWFEDGRGNGRQIEVTKVGIVGRSANPCNSRTVW